MRRFAVAAVALCVLATACSDGAAPECLGESVDCAGTCVSLRSDSLNCGACGAACAPGTTCSGGTCQITCAAGSVICDGSCVDPLEDRRYCGAEGTCADGERGIACGSGQVCVAGTCRTSCPPGQIVCAGRCVDPRTDNLHCGASGTCEEPFAGTWCPAGFVCSGGTCGLTCQAGLINCGGRCTDPLEDRSFCGASGSCSGATAGTSCERGEVCSGGTCAVACQEALVACDGRCVDPLVDPRYCGADESCTLGQTCAAGDVCDQGVCRVPCEPGLLDCDGTCVDPATDPAFCGASGTCSGAEAGEVCPADHVCTDGVCSCPTGLTACDSACVDLSSDDSNCGACGVRCDTGACEAGTCRPAVITRTDILFVVDDSGSMGGEQAQLTVNFASFVERLDQENADRRTAGLEPIDFHIAVTSTSMFWNQNTDGWTRAPWTCTASCTGATGQLVCCDTSNTPAQMPRKCTPGVTVCPSGTTCGTNCIGMYPGAAALKGENYCCVQGATTSATAYPAGYVGDTIPCSRVGVECGRYERHYNFAGCGESGSSNGVAMSGWPYPQGDFVSWTDATTANPRVLHFDKELYPATPDPNAKNKQGFTRQQLVDFFSGGEGRGGNAIVGVCGSGQEQTLGAARTAIEKARGGHQTDTYARTSATPTPTWNATTRAAASAADWLAPGSFSKLVVVFVGDEDDCSPTASDPSGAVVWDTADLASGGIDSCALDSGRSAPLGGKLHSVESFVNFFTGLGREVAAGFILPAAQQTCDLATCTSDALCCPLGGCGSNQGAQQRGVRLLATAHELSSRGVGVIAGSVCDGNYAAILASIAGLAVP